MSEEEVLEILEKIEKGTAQEIADNLDISVFSVRNNLRRMLAEGSVDRIELTRREVKIRGGQFVSKHYIWKINEKWQREIL